MNNTKKIIFILFILFFISCQKDELTIKQEDKMIDLINETRSEGCECDDGYFESVGNLIWDDELTNIAQDLCNDMKNNDFFDNIGSDGKSLEEKLDSIGYTWTYCGQNIFSTYYDGNLIKTSVIEIMYDEWIKDNGFCHNIMFVNYSNVGLSKINVTKSGTQYTYWVIIFAGK